MKKIYILICKLYNFIFSNLEKHFLNNQKKNNYSNLNTIGYEIIKINHNSKVYMPESTLNTNQYMTKDIMKKEDIKDFINHLFVQNNLMKIVTNKTGYFFSIDYFISYTTYKISETEMDKDIYANQWHLDKPFSKNTLKIIIPLNFHDQYNGGLKIINTEETKKLNQKKLKFSESNIFQMDNRQGNILLFFPNLCFHKAGNPILYEGRKQIMMQLNPSIKWSINEDIYKKQFKIEPKFPFFSYILNKKTSL